MSLSIACLHARLVLGSAVVLVAAACTPAAPEAPPQAPAAPEVAEPMSKPTPNAAAVSGMIRPTKGGYLVGQAVVDGDLLKRALADAPARDPRDAEWFLGAVVRIEGEIHEEGAPAAEDPDGPVVQTRTGPSTAIRRIDAVTVEKPAVTIEGELGRSKGLFALGGHLITAQDLDWALAPDGGRPGKRVRLRGQPRTYVCDPNEQCLISGSLPLFDVARASATPRDLSPRTGGKVLRNSSREGGKLVRNPALQGDEAET